MIPSPIRKALSTIRRHQVAHLLMGGQACVLYGAAEFSRDLDLALLPDPANLDRLEAALAELDAEVIAVPPLALKHLTEGLAVHFRCRNPEVAGLRIDVMAQMRGVAPFPELWARRTTLVFDDETLDVMALPDLVAAKKTQRDKDWPMIRRLVDVNYLNHWEEPTPERVLFWLRELRTPELLVEAARSHAGVVGEIVRERPLLKLATSEHLVSGALGRALRDEEDAERGIVQGILGIRMEEDGMPHSEDGTHPRSLAGKSAADYLEMLHKARAATHSALRSWDDRRLAETRNVDGHEVSLAWVLYHLVEHFAYHLGQIAQLASLRRRESKKMGVR